MSRRLSGADLEPSPLETRLFATLILLRDQIAKVDVVDKRAAKKSLRAIVDTATDVLVEAATYQGRVFDLSPTALKRALRALKPRPASPRVLTKLRKGFSQCPKAFKLGPHDPQNEYAE